MARKKKRLAEAEDVNLVPIMNLVTILIPFLLVAIQFVSLAVIDSTLPAIGPPSAEVPDEDEQPLNLSLMITDEGYTIAGADAVLRPEGGDADEEAGPTIPCKEPGCPTPDSYDIAELTRMLGMVKDEYPNDENVILVPESSIAYEVLVRTMDASREDASMKVDGKPRLLFPFVVIAGGAQ